MSGIWRWIEGITKLHFLMPRYAGNISPLFYLFITHDEHATQDQKQTDMIISRQADSLFQDQRYIQAAQAYAKCTRSFEYVALRFVDADEKDALRIYLSERLNRLPKAVSRADFKRVMALTMAYGAEHHPTNDVGDLADRDILEQM